MRRNTELHLLVFSMVWSGTVENCSANQIRSFTHAFWKSFFFLFLSTRERNGRLLGKEGTLSFLSLFFGSCIIHFISPYFFVLLYRFSFISFKSDAVNSDSRCSNRERKEKKKRLVSYMDRSLGIERKKERRTRRYLQSKGKKMKWCWWKVAKNVKKVEYQWIGVNCFSEMQPFKRSKCASTSTYVYISLSFSVWAVQQ